MVDGPTASEIELRRTGGHGSRTQMSETAPGTDLLAFRTQAATDRLDPIDDPLPFADSIGLQVGKRPDRRRI